LHYSTNIHQRHFGGKVTGEIEFATSKRHGINECVHSEKMNDQQQLIN